MTIILGAIVSMLIFFFQRWWTANHPITPTMEAKAQFVRQVERPRNFWMGAKRGEYAGKMFDKFKMKYDSNIHQVSQDQVLNEQQAGELAARIAEGITLDPSEL